MPRSVPDVEVFCEAVRESVAPHSADLAREWLDWLAGVEGANERFTGIWKKEGDGIYDRLGNALGLRCVREKYHRVDAVYSADGGCRKADVLIALEHENNISTASGEMKKLAALDAPLNIVVTYPVTGTPDQEKSRYLSDYERILAESGPRTGQHLLVFGTLSNRTIEWTFHLFAESTFREL